MRLTANVHIVVTENDKIITTDVHNITCYVGRRHIAGRLLGSFGYPVTDCYPVSLFILGDHGIENPSDISSPPIVPTKTVSEVNHEIIRTTINPSGCYYFPSDEYINEESESIGMAFINTVNSSSISSDVSYTGYISEAALAAPVTSGVTDGSYWLVAYTTFNAIPFERDHNITFSCTWKLYINR